MIAREALKKLLLESDPIHERDLDDDWGDGEIEEIADHLLSNGVIVPPVKAGDKLFRIVDMPYTLDSFVSSFPETVEPYSIVYKNLMGSYSCIPFDDFGKTVFLTKEEAERALKERSEGE